MEVVYRMASIIGTAGEGNLTEDCPSSQATTLTRAKLDFLLGNEVEVALVEENSGRIRGAFLLNGKSD